MAKKRAQNKTKAGRTNRDETSNSGVAASENSKVTPVIWGTPLRRNEYKYPKVGISEHVLKENKEVKDKKDVGLPTLKVLTQFNPRLVIAHTKPLAPLFHGWKPSSETGTFDCYENCYLPATGSPSITIGSPQLNYPSNATNDDTEVTLAVTDYNWSANAVGITPTTPAAEVFATEVWPIWNKMFYRMYQNETKSMPLSAFIAYLGFINDIQCLTHDVVVALGLPQPDFANTSKRVQSELDVIYQSYKPEYSKRLTDIIERASKLPAIKGYVQFTNDCLQPFRPATMPECVIVPMTEMAFARTSRTETIDGLAGYCPFITSGGAKCSLNVVPKTLDVLELLLDKVEYEFESEIAEMLLRMPDTLGTSGFIQINTPLIDIEMTEALMNSGVDYLEEARPPAGDVAIAGNTGAVAPTTGQVFYTASADDPASGFWYPDGIAQSAVRDGTFWAYTEMGMSMRSLMNVPVYIQDSDSVDKEYAHSGLVVRHSMFILSMDPNSLTSAHSGWVKTLFSAFTNAKNIQLCAATAKYKKCVGAWLDSNVKRYDWNYLAYRDVIEAMVVAMGINEANTNLANIARGAANPTATQPVAEQMSR